MIIKSEIMDEAAVRRSLTRITHEIMERNRGTADLCIIGIRRRGAVLADILAANIEKFENTKVPVAYIDITMYRDDLRSAGSKLSELSAGQPGTASSIPFDITGKRVILVDDVIYTGRTARAAIEAIFSHGRPSSIQLAVLIDRGHRELPIRPDFVGKNIPTSKEEVVSVRVDEFDGSTGVCICADRREGCN
ncbi:MAG: bifunctional pyr operon transcriptional regulator/uracil phosphoribosyltransferase PyrR [Clostridia bacterium]|nr:bifunctional pyr operon transcriptional regulator/uracil phosphoribosyltransferase PyrR [Clostridia bacterium]